MASQLPVAEDLVARGHAVVGTQAVFHATDGRVRIIPAEPLRAGGDVADHLLRRSRIRFGQGFIQTSMLLMDRALAIAEPWNPALRRHQDWDLIIRTINRPDTEFAMVRKPLVHIMQGSAHSVSVSPDWQASLEWLCAVSDAVSGRARSDFITAVALRSALAARDRHGVLQALRTLRHAPHAAAVIVGASGVLRRR
ncbi:hypothetical protein GCM10009547_25750 [Sporichthya brevicatena]|uniref:Uncharacterized protein n=1 Tax=Sporichthya brevicatena TaxID=171442 RepID=A0ABN1GWR1_9ACTN